MLNFIGIGAQKAGTTWLYEQLSQHPQVKFPGGKEVHFWDQHYDKGSRWYRELFRQTTDHPAPPEGGNRRAFGDITPAYAYLPEEKIRELYALFPAARLIYILRNPIERAWSSAEMARRRAELTPDEPSNQWYLDHFHSKGSRSRGDYRAAIETWRKVFPADQLLLLRFDDLKNNPRALLKACAAHIGISTDYFDSLDDATLSLPVFAGEQLAPRAELLPALEKLYGAEIADLEKALAWDLSGWRPAPSKARSKARKKVAASTAAAPRRHALFILGMHRSGTSALTRICNLLGAQLGSNMMAAQPDNERGFWENEDLVSLNEALMNELGRAWNDPSALPPNWLSQSTVPSYQNALSEIVARDFHDSALWAVKDPRLSLLLPLWAALAEEHNSQIHCLIAVRNPLEVAGSLKRRNSLPMAQGLLLWLRYSLSAEAVTRGRARAFVTYPQILADWEATMNRLGREMALTWPRKPATIRDQVSDFLTADLRHQKADLAALQQAPEVTELVLRGYTALLRLSENHDDPAGLAELDDLHQACDLVFQTLDPVLEQLSRDNRRAHLEIYPRNHELELERARQQLLITQMGQEQRRLLESETRLSDSLRDQTQARQQQAADLQRIQQENQDLAGQVDQLRNSSSWKLTAPLRWVTKKITGR